jgi:hypothetical protein
VAVLRRTTGIKKREFATRPCRILLQAKRKRAVNVKVKVIKHSADLATLNNTIILQKKWVIL